MTESPGRAWQVAYIVAGKYSGTSCKLPNCKVWHGSCDCQVRLGQPLRWKQVAITEFEGLALPANEVGACGNDPIVWLGLAR